MVHRDHPAPATRHGQPKRRLGRDRALEGGRYTEPRESRAGASDPWDDTRTLLGAEQASLTGMGIERRNRNSRYTLREAREEPSKPKYCAGDEGGRECAGNTRE